MKPPLELGVPHYRSSSNVRFMSDRRYPLTHIIVCHQLNLIPRSLSGVAHMRIIVRSIFRTCGILFVMLSPRRVRLYPPYLSDLRYGSLILVENISTQNTLIAYRSLTEPTT
ncbi:hypothetical protein M0802_010933 [Mischocyttarus mexicanus]|nr:hypothetical protein M0802_010972 [Mischocyttarus mexicanus]KAI4489623.1 hypothetical protein M0802_010933 [Mischocyttarus mexicanus]